MIFFSESKKNCLNREGKTTARIGGLGGDGGLGEDGFSFFSKTGIQSSKFKIQNFNAKFKIYCCVWNDS
jgi:hypothetical protein